VAAGESGGFSVLTQAGCSWTPSTTFSWIHITSGSGSGNGSVSYTVDANPTANPRSGTITVQGQTFAINQAGIACTYLLNPTAANHGDGAESGGFSVTAPTGCSWTSTATFSWIHITSGNGTGNGSIAYTVDANPTADPRSGTISVQGQTFTINQAGIACTYAVNPASADHGADSETRCFSIIAPSGCSWVASTSAPWIHITSGSGNGNGEVCYTLDANPVCLPRSATIIVAGQAFAITQRARTQPGVIYVNCDSTGGDGSSPWPFPTIGQAYAAACNADTLRLAPCNYPDTGTFRKALRLEAPSGPVNMKAWTSVADLRTRYTPTKERNST
jgi:hypothetical protein